MKNQRSPHSRAPKRLDAESRTSLLVVGRDVEFRLFLRASLQRWYQIAEEATGDTAAEHLEYCPPGGLIVGQMTSGDEEALISALHVPDSPPVLKVWRKCPPAGWADAALRHPFTRAHLLRAVDRLVYGEASEGDSRPLRPNEVRLKTDAEA